MSGERQAMMDDIVNRVDGLMAERRRQFCAHPLHRGVSLVQMYILMALQERGPMTMSEVAALLQIAPPSASAIVDRLEEHGQVRRARDEVDRRVVRVEIAESGRHVVGSLMGVRQEEMRGLLAGMSDEELEAVHAGMLAVCNAIARSRAGEDERPTTAA